MELTNSRLSRRALLNRAAPAIAGSLAAIYPARIFAHEQKAAESKSSKKIWSSEYWTKKGDISLYIYRKKLEPPKPGERASPILFLAHGSSVSSRPSFDLTVPGHSDYSLMDKFAEYGFDVWTMDFEGYGRSGMSTGNSDIATGADNINSAAEIIRRETGQSRFHLMGESSGALRAGVFAMSHPEHVERLVLVSLTYTGEGSPTLSKRTEQADYYRTHNRRPRDREMIRSIFTRDKPGTSDPAVAEAMANAELKFGDSVPTGSYLDMTTRLPIVDPLKIKSPVLIARGEYDGIATEDDLLNFFKKLPVPDREMAILPGASHSIALGLNRRQFWHVMRCFLEMPNRMDV